MGNKTLIYRLKSDNFNTYVSEDAYNELVLQMSTGDHACHKYKILEVSPDQLDDIRFNSKLGFVDFIKPDHRLDQDDENHWYFYDGKGDCWVENDLGVPC